MLGTGSTETCLCGPSGSTSTEPPPHAPGWAGTAAGVAARRDRMRRSVLGAGDRRALAESTASSCPTLPGLGSPTRSAGSTRRRSPTGSPPLLRVTCDEQPTLVAHSLLRQPRRALRGRARRSPAAAAGVVYAAPGIGPYRMPLGLRVVAIRFGRAAVRAQPAERFDSLGRSSTSTGPASATREWLDAFSAYTAVRVRRVPHVKRTMRQLISDRRPSGSRTPSCAASTVPTALLWGRHDRFVPLALAEGCKREARLAAAGHRRRRPCAPHRAGRCVPAGAARVARSRQRFWYTDTCAGLSAVNGSRRHPAHRPSRRIPGQACHQV